MKIENPEKLKSPEYPRICDIEYGECFCFADDNELYMRCDDYMFVSVCTGELFSIENYQDTPIIQINAKIIIQ